MHERVRNSFTTEIAKFHLKCSQAFSSEFLEKQQYFNDYNFSKNILLNRSKSPLKPAISCSVISTADTNWL